MTQVEARPLPTAQSVPNVPVIGPATQGLGEYLERAGKLTRESFQRVRSEALQIVKRCKPFDSQPGTETGLVVGYVQSGKTMSMTAVASLARDNGCRIVILLAGVTTNLLKQNTDRFRDTLRAAADGKEHWLIINSADGKETDSEILRQSLNEWRDSSFPRDQQRCIFLAVLKNHAHLSWLHQILDAQIEGSTNLCDVPVLVLDDEADQAGLNVGDDDEPSRTYARICEIRSALPNHTYLQYTATPQAPLLINIDDILSPRFAELVEPGDAYTGGQSFFPEGRPHPHIVDIPKADLFKPGEPPRAAPQSLREALATYFVASAVARQLGKPKTRSMLIHPSQLNDDQNAFFAWTQKLQNDWSKALSNVPPTLPKELSTARLQLSATAKTLPELDTLVQNLKLSLSRALLHKVNSQEVSGVDWANGGDHILVGGEKLNRGYTVEGLMTTYMPRDAGGWNADTIQQRARFFGYKRDFLDLCRIYIHPDVHRAYSNYVVHERDIRRQLAEHRGRPLRDWRRAFFLDSAMRPTRNIVLDDPLFRVKRDKHWFAQSYPHANEGDSVRFNLDLVARFKDKLQLETFVGKHREYAYADTNLDTLLSGLLLDFKVVREAILWYIHLVSVSDLRARDKEQRARIYFMDKDGHGTRRFRSVESAQDKIKVQQGRSSADNDRGSDRTIVDASVVTLQIHHLNVAKNRHDKMIPVDAIALYVPRRHDAIGGGRLT